MISASERNLASASACVDYVTVSAGPAGIASYFTTQWYTLAWDVSTVPHKVQHGRQMTFRLLSMNAVEALCLPHQFDLYTME